MTGALLQLASMGSEDNYINGNPQITFFKSVYKKYHNYARENIKIFFNGNDKLNYNNTTTLYTTIPRNADLLSDIFFQFELPNIFSNYGNNENFKWIKKIGTNIINTVKFFIGDKLIETITGEFIDNYYSMKLNKEDLKNFYKMTGNVDEINDPYRNIEQMYMINNNSETYLKNNVNYLNKYYNSLPSISEQNIIVPIPLWFSRNKGLNLPFHALNQDIIIRMQIELKAIKDLYTISSIEEIDLSPSMDEDGNTIDHSLDKKILSNGFEKWNNNKIYKLNTIKPFKIEHEFKKFIKSSLNQWNLSPTLLVDYIFLEPETSKKIKKENRQFFIDKVIKSEHLGNIGEVTIKPELYHPSKEIIFNIKRSDMIDINNHSNYTNFDDESLINNNLDYQNQFLNLCIKQFRLVNTKFETLNNNYENMLKSNDKLHDLAGNLLIKTDYKPKQLSISAISLLGNFRGDINKTKNVKINKDKFGVIFKTIKDVDYKEIEYQTDKWVLTDKDPSIPSILTEDLLIYSQQTLTNEDISNLLDKWEYRKSNEIPNINIENYEYFQENIPESMEIKFNGGIRLNNKDYEYFNKIQPLIHHTSKCIPGVMMYSFSLFPEIYQPSGACNFTALNKVEFAINFKNPIPNESPKKNSYKYDLNLYNISYNVLDLSEGNCRLLYST